MYRKMLFTFEYQIQIKWLIYISGTADILYKMVSFSVTTFALVTDGGRGPGRVTLHVILVLGTVSACYASKVGNSCDTRNNTLRVHPVISSWYLYTYNPCKQSRLYYLFVHSVLLLSILLTLFFFRRSLYNYFQFYLIFFWTSILIYLKCLWLPANTGYLGFS